ncbi:hypothetical protein CRYUN_Cryun25bG0104800 [Craigia yunnanensis]
MCECASNLGLGAPLPSNEQLDSKTGWFATNQSLLEVIFHNRMKQCKCLTKDPTVASAIYVPYYAGLDVGRYLWDPDGFMRVMMQRDHKNESDWGNELLNFSESRNMTMLVIESSPWNNKDFAIPPNFHESIRNEIIDQCLATRRKCRRSIFDSILAGCIPVFFHQGSAYGQYIWHFTKDYAKYSVLIPANDVKSGDANIERILQRIPREKRLVMSEEIIKLIPKVIYADPSSRLGTIEDAFDLTVKGVFDSVETVRNQMRDAKEVNSEFDEQESWKYFTFGKLGVHEWDPYFSRKLGA